MVVYLDLLILDNFCADAALLYCAVRTVKGNAKLWRIVLSALLGTVLGTGYTILCLYYTLPGAVDFIIKYSVAAILPLTAANFKKKRTYVLCSAAFLGYMFAFAGILTALFGGEMSASGDTLVYTVYGIPSGILVMASVIFAFIGIKVAKRISERGKVLSCTLECLLCYKEKSVKVRGFADTGNRLRDRHGKEVAVAERSVILPLFSDFSDRPDHEKIRVQTVNGNSEFFVFRIDRIKIYFQGKEHTIEDVAVAISPQPLAGEYEIILPPSFAKEEYFR